MKNVTIQFFSYMILIVFAQCTCKTQTTGCQKEDNVKYLVGDSIKYWDPYYNFKEDMFGRGWCFASDSSFQEYRYVDQARCELDYGDLIWEGFYFELVADTLFIKDYNDYTFLIIDVNEDSLIVKDISSFRYSYMDTILFLRSNDQETKPGSMIQNRER